MRERHARGDAKAGTGKRVLSSATRGSLRSLKKESLLPGNAERFQRYNCNLTHFTVLHTQVKAATKKFVLLGQTANVNLYHVTKFSP